MIKDISGDCFEASVRPTTQVEIFLRKDHEREFSKRLAAYTPLRAAPAEEAPMKPLEPLRGLSVLLRHRT
jgi:hypothetical protein